MNKRIKKAGLVLGLGIAVLAGSFTPTYADPGGAIAAGVIGGTALGLLAGSAAAGAYPPPPPAYVVPAYGQPCRRVFVRTWDPYAGVYVDRPHRICD